MNVSEAPSRKKLPSSVVFLSLLLVELLFYGPALVGGPLVDDFALLSTAKYGFVFGNFAASPTPGLFWRPAVSLLLKSEWLAFGMNIWEYRAISLVLCALTGTAIYAVLVKVTGNKLAALASALLFVIWPSHPETVLWIAGQTDGLATCFAWLALWALLSWWSDAKPRFSKVTLWIIFLIVALVSKESIVVVPLMLLGLLIATSGFSIRSRAGSVIFVAIVMVVLTAGYLWLRGDMIHVSFLGGGYHIAQSRSLLQTIASDFFSYHLTNNLLNAYAPLSNRISAGWLNLSSDAMITLLFVFGISWIVRRLPGRINAPFYILPGALFAYLLCAIWMTFGSYPFLFLQSIASDPSGLIASLIVVALVAAMIFRYRNNLAQEHRNQMVAITRSTWFAVTIVAIAVVVVAPWLHNGALPQWLFIFGVPFWVLMYLTRQERRNQDIDGSRRVLVCAFALTAASIFAILPVLTIRQVNDNLANARLSYLATTFSVPAIVCGVVGSIRRPWLSQSLLAVFAVLASIASIFVVNVWRQSEHISSAFMHEVNRTSSRQMYVICSPGIAPSATTVILGGFFLANAGALSNNDVNVIPGYSVDGFTVGDHIAARRIGPATWRVSAIAGNCKYRSGNLAILRCKDEEDEYSDRRAQHDAGALDITITHLRPQDEVVLADEHGVVVLRH